MRIALTASLSSVLLFGMAGASPGREAIEGAPASHHAACPHAKLAEAKMAAAKPSDEIAAPAIRVPFRVRIANFGP
jgi:hypothetical protein